MIRRPPRYIIVPYTTLFRSSSSFTDFSLAELFQLIDPFPKSGCLTVCTLPDLHTPGSKAQYYYIWFRQGRVVAATNRLKDRKSTRLNSSHANISYAVFCLKK